jgi:anti-sigma factor RsiW
MKNETSDEYSDEEAEQRFHALVRRAMQTPPKQLKDVVGTTPRAKMLARHRRRAKASPKS